MIKSLYLLLVFLFLMAPKTIFEFNLDSNLSNWKILDDRVMGGKSLSTFSLNKDGDAVFKGAVSLRNNGGFSSVFNNFEKILINKQTKICVKLKGDGKKYQVRIKSNSKDYFSYKADFLTTGEWQEIEIPLESMFPTYRGRKLDKPNFSNAYFEQISFFIANKKEEKFKLLIKNIALK